jgi:hypothetical protein
MVEWEGEKAGDPDSGKRGFSPLHRHPHFHLPWHPEPGTARRTKAEAGTEDKPKMAPGQSGGLG